MKVSICGDVHISDRTPRSRCDDYLQSSLNKLDFVLDSAPITIFLGDVFDRFTIGTHALYQIILVLQKHKLAGKKAYTIIGNHDIPNLSESSLPKTALGILEALGLITIIYDEIVINNTYINTIPLKFNFTEMNVAASKNPGNSILLGHHFYQNIISPTHSFSKEHFSSLGYKYIFFGHDHQPYAPVQISDDCALFRPGSLMRNSAFEYNIYRDKPFFYQLELNDNGLGSVNMITVDIAKIGTEVFAKDIIESKKFIKNDSFMQSIENLIKGFRQNTINDSLSLISILNEIKTPKPIFEYIQRLHSNNSINFN